MELFLQENWLVLLSLLVALVGGVPGFIKVLDHIKNRPIFTFMLENLVTGEMNIQAKQTSTAMILLTGTASNKGAIPLSPAYFNLKAHISTGWINFERMIIPPGTRFNSHSQIIDLQEPETSDMQRYRGSISEATPVRGNLMFTSSQVTNEELKNIMDWKLQLECVDIFGRKHHTDVDLHLSGINQPIIYPKHGLTITPKK